MQLIVILLYLRPLLLIMESKLSYFAIQVNPTIYLKNPESSELGKKILSGSVNIIAEIGFEQFTFKKLAKEIGSTEASVYRYFENKHKLLLYLTSWYWGWMQHRLSFSLANIDDRVERLRRAIVLITQQVEEDSSFSHINEVKLHQIVICESSKVYLIKEVDSVNESGVFSAYKNLVQSISDEIYGILPNYKYAHMLISTVIEGVHHQRYFADHLPRLTDVIEGEDAITDFYLQMVFKTLDIN